MLTVEEKKFVDQWKKKRLFEKSLFQQLRFVVPIALIAGAATLLNLFTGWYTRANMVANSQFSPLVLIIGIIIIATFCSVFYKRHRWEMNEQRYLELLQKNNNTSMQHQEAANSQVGN
jgi:hypothetical protein